MHSPNLKSLVKRPGLVILIIVLSLITLGIIKPEFYLLGWDNFSSYLNLKSSLFNTLFTTWREHRGLGVPSDAEINDLFRQFFSLTASFFVPKNLVDQLYFIFMLWGGVLGMYKLGRYVGKLLNFTEKKQELFAFLASFFYLFNLSTLAVFYFPMIMYVTRFFMLPTTIYILLRIFHDRHLSKLTCLLYLLVLFIGMGAFMVPTIFIVLMVMLILMLLIFPNRKRVFLVIGFYVLLNAYWILPFTNYTLQKGATVPEAPLFIDINEAMLTKPKSYFSFENQAKLRPGFFDSQFTNNVTSNFQPFHELAGFSDKGITRILLWIFPLTYLLGILYIFLFKREKLLVWFAVTTIVFLVLSLKEYSFLGFLYGFISDHVPFANTVLRFGDTKFHAMIAFCGSLISAFFIIQLINITKRIKINHLLTKLIICLIFGCLVVPSLFIFKSYFNGNFIGFFMYNKIPSFYFDISDTINKDSENLRVIHLPLDNRSYWKPYTWGYFGSSFLHFMLNKPLFDRTFEPASLENAEIHQQILDIINSAPLVSETDLLEKRALDLYYLLQSISIKYIIDDGTISTNIDSRNVSYWGKINPADSHRLLSFLEQKGYLKLVKQYEFTNEEMQSFAQDYEKLYPYNKIQTLDQYHTLDVNLYQLINPSPRFQFVSETDKVNTSYKSLLPQDIRNSLTVNYIQAEKYDNQSLVFPFTQNSKAEIANNQINLSLPTKLPPGAYVFESKNNPDISQTQLVNVSIQKVNNFLRVYFESPVFPEIKDKPYLNPKTYQTLDLAIEREDFKYLKIEDNLLPVENIAGENMQYIGAVLIHSNSVPVSLLYPANAYNLSNDLVQLEQNPQCLNDSLGEATSEITGDNGILHIGGQNVSNCLTTEASLTLEQELNNLALAELKFTVSGKVQSLQKEKTNLDTSKPQLNKYVNTLDNPFMMHVCIKPDDSSVCVNKDNLFRITGEENTYSVPVAGNLSNLNKFLITFTVRSSQRQKYDTNTTNIVLTTYLQSEPQVISLLGQTDYRADFESLDNNNLNISIQPAKSVYSQFVDLKKDPMLLGFDASCELDNKYQSIKETGNGILFYDVGCKNFINRNIPFLSSNFYFWLVQYKHLSGALPAFILMDKINTYTYAKLIPVEVNADSYFSLPLQKPESIFEGNKAIASKINSAPIYTVSGFIEAQPDLLDNTNKEMIIEQFSQNEGLAELINLSLVELPGFWSKSRIRPVDYQVKKYETQAQISASERVLPSLWKITVKTDKEGEYLALFNEQYDKQWIIVNNKSSLHARCNGYANCYETFLAKGESTYYLFYFPELLSFFGILISLGTGLKFIFGKPRN